MSDDKLPYFGGSNLTYLPTTVDANEDATKTSNISRTSTITFLPDKWSSAIRQTNQVNKQPPELPQLSKEVKKRLQQLGLLQIINGSKIQKSRIHKYEKNGSVYQGKVARHGEDQVPNGNGNLYLAGGSLFTGNFVNGYAQGPGRLFLPNGNYYEGNFNNNTISGNGKFVEGEIVFQGDFKNGVLHGRGSLKCPQATFTGNFIDGYKSQGTFVWGPKKQYTYTGQFVNELFHGKGLMKTPEGVFEGQFVQGHKNGYGVFAWVKGCKYKGEYQNDLRSGYGEFFNRKGESEYKGFWQNDKPYAIVLQQTSDPRKHIK